MSPSLPPGPDRRRRVVDALCEAFARDELALPDFERRIEAAHRAATALELDAVLDDLPGARTAADGLPERAGPRPPREVIAGILGGSSRHGRWEPARRVTAVGVMGGVELDFREAVLPPGVTEVYVFAFWGGVEILAPPGVRVESSGVGILGGFEHGDASDTPVAASAPTLRISGVAVMGGVEISVRYAGESGREARRRVKEARAARLRDGDRG